MTADELKTYQKAQPFKPFRIVLNDGRTYDVPHPNFMWVWGSTVHVGTHGDVERGLCDRSERIALTTVKQAEIIALAPRAADGVAGR